MDAEWYVKQIDKTIVEMKFTGTPIDQILRHGATNKSDSIVIKYYSSFRLYVLRSQFWNTHLSRYSGSREKPLPLNPQALNRSWR